MRKFQTAIGDSTDGEKKEATSRLKLSWALRLATSYVRFSRSARGRVAPCSQSSEEWKVRRRYIKDVYEIRGALMAIMSAAEAIGIIEGSLVNRLAKALALSY